MVAPWVLDEMKNADLKDKRLHNRLREVLSRLGGHPTASIPAAYRLFDNPKATLASIPQPHTDATRQRLGRQAVVVLAQDTTEVDLTRPEQQVAGAGPLDGGPGLTCGAPWGLFDTFATRTHADTRQPTDSGMDPKFRGTRQRCDGVTAVRRLIDRCRSAR